MRSLRFGMLTVLLGSFWLGGVASADDRGAALLPFQGPQASKVRQRVQSGLRAADVRLVPLKQVTAVTKGTKGYAKQAAKLDASALVRTHIRRVEGRWIAKTEIRNAKGQRVEELGSNSSSITRLSNRIVNQLIKTGLLPVASPSAAVAGSTERATEPEAPTQPRLVIRPFKGTQAAKIRGAAVRGLRSEPVELFPNQRFDEKARSLGADPNSIEGHVAPATDLAVSGLIEGDVLREDGVWSVYVRLVDGKSAKVIVQHFYAASTSSGLAKSVQTKIGPDFRKDIEMLGVAVPAEVPIAPVEVTAAPAAKVVSKEEVASKHESKAPKSARPAAVDIEVDFRLLHRSFTYSDVVSSDLRDYTLNIAPGVGTKFQYYPGAHFTSGVGAQFGVDFEWERLFPFDSTRADGARFPTQSQQFLIGLRWRYPKGRWEPTVILDYGVHTFEFGVSGPPVPGEDTTPGVPSVKYEFARVGGGFRVSVGKKERLILAMSAAFRGVFSVGGIGTYAWFPQAKANGMDAMLMLGYALPKGFEIRISGDYRGYWFALNPVPPNPPYVAGGALDQYWGASIGVAWRR